MTTDPSLSQQAQGSYIAQATGGGTATVQVVLPPPAVQEQNRVRFLKRLRALYEDLWEQSLQGAALMTLGLREQPDVVLHHTERLLRAPQQPQRPLPEGITLLEVYDEAGQELLLLGEPGAGKSTLLLELARELVGRAEQDLGHPFPVILPLSSWAVKQPPLPEWLAAQVSLIYDVPRQLSRTWVQTNQLLPLLDGLDEVPEQARAACIEAITTYRQEHLVPLVVCSRRAEYEQLAPQERLVMHSAVLVEPLTQQQVQTYLDQAGQSLAAVRTVLHTNPVLQELTTTPLMLSVLTLTYAGAAEQDLPQRGRADEQQQQIFTTYVERMVMRKGDVVHYPLERTKAWLGWLAQQMRQHGQTIFYLERLQPDWLPQRQRAFYRWSIRLVGGLVGLVFGLVFGLVTRLVFGLVGGLVGLVGGLVSGRGTKIEPTEALIWSRKSLVYGLVGGLVVGLIGGLVVWLAGEPAVWLVGELVVGLVGGLVVGLVVELSRKQLTERHMLSPNEGIRRSIKNGLRVWLIFGLAGLVFGLVGGLGGGLVDGLRTWLVFGLVGLGSGLAFGLEAAMYHYILRFWLWRSHSFPWKTVPFLEDATTRILLRRVGGGYSFVHRLLLDYFADLEATARTAVATQPPSAMKVP